MMYNLQLHIDGLNAFTQWGVYTPPQGLNSLLSPCALVAPVTTDWPESDGTEADLLAPRLDSREISVNLQARSPQGYDEFISLVSDGQYHTWRLAGLNDRTYRLRYLGQSSLNINRGVYSFTLRLADDFPPDREALTYAFPSPWQGITRGYVFDSVDLSNYGLSVMQGTLARVRQHPDIKTGVAVTTSDMLGTLYDCHTAPYKPYDITLEMFTHQASEAALWGVLDSLMADMLVPGTHTLSVADAGVLLTVYYHSATVKEFWPDGHPWLSLSLTLTVINTQRL